MENNCQFIDEVAKAIKVISWILLLGGFIFFFGGFIYSLLGIFIDEPFFRIEHNISMIEYISYSISAVALGIGGVKEELEESKNKPSNPNT